MALLAPAVFSLAAEYVLEAWVVIWYLSSNSPSCSRQYKEG